MEKEKIKEVMSYLGKRSIEKQHKGKTKKQMSDHMRKVSLSRWKKNGKLSKKI